MTRGESSFPKRGGLVAALLVAALGLGACGGGSSKPTTTTSPTTTSAATTKHAKHGPATVRELIHAAGAKAAVASAKASPGQSLVFRTIVPKSVGSGQTVSLDFAAGPSKSLTVKATAGGHSASATVQSANGKPLTLTRLRYTCNATGASFCPAKGVSSSKSGYHLQFAANHSTGVTVAATVGPVKITVPKVKAPGSAKVAPYATSQQVRLIPQSGGSSSNVAPLPLTASVSASPGNVVLAVTRVKPKKGRGAEQPITVTISRKSGKSVTVSAQSAGGSASTATIKSANGSAISLADPRYTCLIAPFPTFCPPTSTKSSAGQYTLTFNAAPGTAAPSVLVTVQKG